MQQALPSPTPPAAVTYSPAAAATLIPAVATPAMGMQHMTTFPGTADRGLPKFTNLDDISLAKVAVSKTTPPSPMPPSTDVIVIEAPAAAC